MSKAKTKTEVLRLLRLADGDPFPTLNRVSRMLHKDPRSVKAWLADAGARPMRDFADGPVKRNTAIRYCVDDIADAIVRSGLRQGETGGGL